MSKFVNVPNGNYKLKVQSGGEIRLDTGLDQGEVVITGDLRVQGTTTFLETTDSVIQDNIIELNNGETGNGISNDESGIQINRGTFVDVRFVFDEDITYTDPVSETLNQGAFTFKDVNGSIIGIQTNAIDTAGGDLYLINSGTGVVSVTGTNNYENQIVDDDHIPNKKYVDDFVTTALTSIFQKRIEDGTTSKSFVEVNDEENTGNRSDVTIGVDGIVTTTFNSNETYLHDLRFSGSQIEPTISNQDLVLSAPGTGSVVVNDVLNLSLLPTIDDPTVDPTAPNSGIKVFAKNVGPGGTGIFYVHEDQTSSELVSRNRSLLYGMIF